VKINEIFAKDELHKSRGCTKPKGRRLYIRDYIDVFNIRWNEPGPKKSQPFRPIGIICVNCGFMRANASAIVAWWNNGKKVKEFIKTLDFSNPPKSEDTHFSRQERRRIDKLRKKRQKKLDKLGINEQEVVITHLD
jgi:hypothetical protein